MTQPPAHLPPHPTAMPAPLKRPFWRRGWFIALVSIVFGFGVGAAAGGGDGSSTPKPAPTVTVTAPAEASVEEKTPQSCLTALDLAAEILDAVAAEHATIGAAAATGDINKFTDGVMQATQELTTTSNRLAPQVAAAATDCRAKA